MKGDVLVIGKNHKRAASMVLALVAEDIRNYYGKFIITVAGESGAGKSEIAASLAKQLKAEGFNPFIFQQDDYFVYPPKTNAEKRREDISWVGPQEVRLDKLDQDLEEARQGGQKLEKPLVDFNEDRIDKETIDLRFKDVLIAEGTYTTLLKNIDCRVFIERDYHDTRQSRMERNREIQDEFLERILEIEHQEISGHAARADILITKDFNAKKQKKW